MREFNAGNKSTVCAALAALFIAACATGARAGEPVSSGWINTGPSGAGGSDFAGNGNVGALGPSTNPALSAGGGDIITLNSGGFAIGTDTSTIFIGTSNDALYNFGTIAGAWGTDGGDGYKAIHLYSGGTLSNDFIFNHGLIIGGEGAYETGSNAGNGGDAVHVYAAAINNSALNNYGTVVGGAGGNGASVESSYDAGNGGNGFFVESGTIVNSSLLFNAPGASIAGGSGGIATGTGGSGGQGGAAVYVVASTANNVGITNAGRLAGGNGGTGGTDGYGGQGGDGIYIDPAPAFTSSGTVTITANNFVINSGVITGGNGGVGGIGQGTGGAGVYYLGSNASVINSGYISGGSGSGLLSGSAGLISSDIITTDTGPEASVNATGVLMQGSYNSVFNTGSIYGGSGGTYTIGRTITTDLAEEIGVGSPGVFMNGNNNTVVNFGYITGGNGAFVPIAPVISTDAILTGSGAPGVFVEGNNNTVVNGGVISGGTGVAVEATITTDTPPVIAGSRGPAIEMLGSNNTVILTGHSTTIGEIMASGSTNTNKLVIAFTGVSPLEQLVLKNQLEAMGVLNGQQSSGSFNFRGTTVTWDPLVVVFNPSSYQLQGLTPNQAAVGANLDSFTVNPTGDMLTVLNAIDASGDVPAALEALSPQRYQIFDDIALANANFTTLQIDQRLNNLRDGSESIDTTGIGGDTAFTGGDETIAGWSKDDGKETKTVQEPTPQEKHWGFFASGDVILENWDGDKDLSSSHFETSGLVLGLDGKVNEKWVLGTFFDYLYTSATMDDFNSKADVSSYGTGLYSGYHDGGFFANGLLGFSHNDYDTSLAVVFPGLARVAQAGTHGNQFEANVDGGYDFTINRDWSAGPIVGLQYVHLGVSDFTESGAGAADLAVNDSDLNSLRSRLGGHIEYRKQIGREVAFAAEARAEWQHEFLDDSRSISGDFIGSGLGGFSVQTTAPQRDAALVGAGLNVTIRDRLTIFTDYDVQAGQSSWFEQSVRAGMKISW